MNIAPPRNKPKARVERDVGLSPADWALLATVKPELVVQMMRNKVTVVNVAVPTPWLAQNATGFFYVESRTVYMENEEDVVLLRLKVSGQS